MSFETIALLILAAQGAASGDEEIRCDQAQADRGIQRTRARVPVAEFCMFFECFQHLETLCLEY